jgi:hypothetical protein
VQDHFASNPGGMAVVWAEENSRDAIFDAIKRRETYATSGTRPRLRFFAGDYPADLCASPDLLDRAYTLGVPMGAQFTPSTATSPQFLVAAQQDPGSQRAPGNPIERIQVIKGWVDDSGETREQIFDVIGAKGDGLGIDTNSCEPTARGLADACTVWEDPQFVAGQNAFYYARLIETPSCRWSTRQCQAAGVNPFASDCEAQRDLANDRALAEGATGPVYDNCCRKAENEPFYSPVIQERAWSSPIWVAGPR